MLRSLDQKQMEGQMAQEAEPLAIVLSRWIKRERLRPQDIERAVDISRNHLWLMTHGKVSRPTPETLRKLALALATDPNDGTVDRLKRDEALRELSQAAGYPHLAEDLDAGDLARAVQALVGNQQATGFWVELISTHRDISPTLQHLIRNLIEMHRRPGGSDAKGVLVIIAEDDPSIRDEMFRRLTGNGETIRR